MGFRVCKNDDTASKDFYAIEAKYDLMMLKEYLKYKKQKMKENIQKERSK